MKAVTYRLTEKETTALIELATTEALDLNFGPSGCWLTWDVETPIPWSVDALLRMRGTDGETELAKWMLLKAE